MVSHNTMLKFYRIFMPEEQARVAAKRYMKQQHKFYRGNHERNPKN